MTVWTAVDCRFLRGTRQTNVGLCWSAGPHRQAFGQGAPACHRAIIIRRYVAWQRHEVRCIGRVGVGFEPSSVGQVNQKENQGPRRTMIRRLTEQAHFMAENQPHLTEPEAALWRSQHGSIASVPSVAFPHTGPLGSTTWPDGVSAYKQGTRPFRVLLCRRLRLPLLSSTCCFR